MQALPTRAPSSETRGFSGPIAGGPQPALGIGEVVVKLSFEGTSSFQVSRVGQAVRAKSMDHFGDK